MFNLKNEELTRLLIVVGCGVLLLFLIKTYYYDNAVASGEETMPTQVNGATTEEGFYNYDQRSPIEDHTENQNNTETQEQPTGNEVMGQAQEYSQAMVSSQNNVSAMPNMPNECYPKDVLNSQDLLPGGADSLYAKVVPSGQGALTDQNFLNAGAHIGVGTVGACRRNPSYDLRSSPPNPQVQVSPWMQSTIEPDLHRRPLE
jgi:hypothetical protein